MTPVVIFTYNRPDHLAKTIDSLKKNKFFEKTNFFIFQDKLELDNCDINHKYNVLFDKLPKNFLIIKRKKNFGLKKNITLGISEILNKSRRIIVCEDDLIFHKDFIFYMNHNLIKYEKIKKISSISGFSPILESQSNFFANQFCLNLTSSWGWGTWKKYWNSYISWDAKKEKKLFYNNALLQNKFDYDGSQSHTLWLKKDDNKMISSWNIQWEFFNFTKGYLTLYPNINFVENKGFDGSGVNCGSAGYKFKKINNNERYKKKNQPIIIDELYKHREIISQNIKDSFFKKIIKKILYFYL
jgi:hypothetical protein